MWVRRVLADQQTPVARECHNRPRMSRPSGKKHGRKRRYPRVKTRLEVALVVGDRGGDSDRECGGQLVNLSEGGALVESPDLAEGSVEIRFDIPQEEQCWGRGRVVRRDGPDRVGVEFADTSESLRSVVRQLLRAADAIHRSNPDDSE